MSIVPICSLLSLYAIMLFSKNETVQNKLFAKWAVVLAEIQFPFLEETTFDFFFAVLYTK